VKNTRSAACIRSWIIRRCRCKSSGAYRSWIIHEKTTVPVLLFPQAKILRSFVFRDSRGHAISTAFALHREESQINPSYKNVNRADVMSPIFQKNFMRDEYPISITKFRGSIFQVFLTKLINFILCIIK